MDKFNNKNPSFLKNLCLPRTLKFRKLNSDKDPYLPYKILMVMETGN